MKAAAEFHANLTEVARLLGFQDAMSLSSADLKPGKTMIQNPPTISRIPCKMILGLFIGPGKWHLEFESQKTLTSENTSKYEANLSFCFRHDTGLMFHTFRKSGTTPLKCLQQNNAMLKSITDDFYLF